MSNNLAFYHWLGEEAEAALVSQQTWGWVPLNRHVIRFTDRTRFDAACIEMDRLPWWLTEGVDLVFDGSAN